MPRSGDFLAKRTPHAIRHHSFRICRQSRHTHQSHSLHTCHSPFPLTLTILRMGNLQAPMTVFAPSTYTFIAPCRANKTTSATKSLLKHTLLSHFTTASPLLAQSLLPPFPLPPSLPLPTPKFLCISPYRSPIRSPLSLFHHKRFSSLYFLKTSAAPPLSLFPHNPRNTATRLTSLHEKPDNLL